MTKVHAIKQYTDTGAAYDDGYHDCLLDGARGIHLPQDFITGFDLAAWGLDPENEDVKEVQAGPDAEYYWDAWDVVLDAARHIDSNGKVWTLYQEDSLYAVCVQDGDTVIEIDW